MRVKLLLPIGFLAFGLSIGCTKKEPEHAATPTPTAQGPSAPAPITPPTAPPAEAEQKPAATPAILLPAPPTPPASAPSSALTTPAPAAKAATAAPPTASGTLDLAKRSGCLACHGVEKKVVGPAWNDVSARYAGDATVKAKLVAKVKAGGKGNWTDVTGGAMMPPYSPRVADADIEALVDFILGLKAK